MSVDHVRSTFNDCKMSQNILHSHLDNIMQHYGLWKYGHETGCNQFELDTVFLKVGFRLPGFLSWHMIV